MFMTDRPIARARLIRRIIVVGLILGVGLHTYRYYDNDGPAYLVMATGDAPQGVLADINGRLFFTATDGDGGPALWTSDGTAAGTTKVNDIDPNASMECLAGRAFLVQIDGIHDKELWKCGGSDGEPVRVKDIRPGPYASWPDSFVDTGGILFFVADDGTHGRELWTSDGTAAGTVMVKDIRQDALPGSTDERRRTLRIAQPRRLTPMGGRTFFVADDGAHGRELWVSDGTPPGTTMVRDIRTGSEESNPRGLIDMSGTLYFTANDANGTELWRSDGTTAGTVLVKAVGRGSSKGPQGLVDANGTLFFALPGGVEGDQLWRSDGSPAGTVLVKVINEGAPDDQLSSITAVGNNVFLVNERYEGGSQLWRSDGTDAGTVLVKDLPGGPYGGPPEGLTEAGGLLYFRLAELDYRPWDSELWRSDGTASGTFQVQDIARGQRSSDPGGFTVIGDKMFFIADNGLWALPIDPNAAA